MTMTTIKSTIGGNTMLGSVLVPNTYETVEVHNNTDTGKIIVNVEFLGYYTMEQLDELIAMLEEAKIIGKAKRDRLQQGTLFENIAGDL